MEDNVRVLIAAGGTGGHLFPAKQLKERLGTAQILFAGYKIKENPFFDQKNTDFVEITASPLNLSFFFKTLKGLWQSFWLLKNFKPDVVVGFGSFHTFPILLASVLMRKKIVLFEANAALGKVNRFFAPFSQKVAGQFFLRVDEKKQALVPFLPWKPQEKMKIGKEEARQYFGLSPQKTTILVFGGSQGAKFLNEEIPRAIEEFSQKKEVQVIHLTGKGSVHYTIESCIKPFETEMEKAYLAADIAICRAGAGTIGELIRYEVPALLIPYPLATEDHQRKNAEFLAFQTKGARMLLQEEATKEKIIAEIKHLLNNKEIYQRILGAFLSKRKKRVDLAEIIRAIGVKK